MVSSAFRRTAPAGADFVIVAISVGGTDAWERDIEIPPPARHLPVPIRWPRLEVEWVPVLGG